MIEFSKTSRAIIFDCDGTLVDTMPVHYQSWLEVLSEYGLAVPATDLAKHMGKPAAVFLADLCSEHGWKLDIPLVVAERDARFRQLLTEVREIAPVAEVARALAGHKPLAVVSGGSVQNVDLALESVGLRSLFPVIITADDPIPGKPSPDIFLEAARRLGVEPGDCLVFEDADAGIEGAMRAGMRVIDVRTHVNTDLDETS